MKVEQIFFFINLKLNNDDDNECQCQNSEPYKKTSTFSTSDRERKDREINFSAWETYVVTFHDLSCEIMEKARGRL